MIDRVMKELESRFSSLELVREMHNYLHVYLDNGQVMEAILNARTLLGFRTLQLISVVDRMEENRFQLTWILENYTDSLVLLFSADYPRENCSVPSLSAVWPAASAFERELFEMYGVSFPGNPREGEDFILEGWKEIPPMRRDFDTEEYSMRVYGERQPRKHTDPRQYIGEIVGEWNTPMGRMRGEEE
ncbi:MAG TPA: NADH-quinone oxidoreductase subunit C [Candidatus Sabulitectum sp.]|nr:NADH-quinone oxidoreductase subunit C [Candidatus Sabulitectum sp.]HPJ28876.1 NADH-quinone oxidoreductase subunit C [Candidatus Sabulitectum sp.]HPR23494.1 NADH-quinone oxidoreductase subunit C [Candidatus Sabulitectum sp.]